MGQSIVGRLAIKAKQIKPGDAFAAVVPAGGLVEIVDLEGKQVAELVAFDRADPSEHLSLGVTRQQSKSIMLSLGMTLYSSRGRMMLDLVEDTVGRHDILWAAPTVVVASHVEAVTAAGEPEVSENGIADGAPLETRSGEPTEVLVFPVDDRAGDPETTDDASIAETTEAAVADSQLDGPPSEKRVEGETSLIASAEPMRDTLTGFPAALATFGMAEIDAPDPVNFFMQLAVMQRGDLELRAPMSERGDRVVLKALTDLIVAVRCSAAEDETNGEKPSDILVRVYR